MNRRYNNIGYHKISKRNEKRKHEEPEQYTGKLTVSENEPGKVKLK
jgi:hypothetical protein